MDNYFTVSEYAKITGKDPGNIRKMLINGRISGQKLGSQWIIPKDVVFPDDARIKSGNCRNWRKAAEVRRANPKLMKAMHKMSLELSNIFAENLVKIVVYGSYARGEETPESDVDIAVILKKNDESLNEAMTDIVVDYELEQGVTLSVVSIDYQNYLEWGKVLPFYKNIDREGIVLWKAA